MSERTLKQILLYEATDSGMKDIAGNPALSFKAHGNIAPLFEAAGMMPTVPNPGLIFRAKIGQEIVAFQISWSQYDPMNTPQVAHVVCDRLKIEGALKGVLQTVDPGSEKTAPEFAQKIMQ